MAAADVLEIHAAGPARGRLVEIDGNLEAPPDLFAHAAGDADTFLESDALDGDKRDDIGGSDARMHAAMAIEVDQLDGLANRADGGLADGLGRAGQGQHGAVVVGVHLLVQQHHAGDGERRAGQSRDNSRVAPLGKVRNALDQSSSHVLFSFRYSTWPPFMVMATRFTPKW